MEIDLDFIQRNAPSTVTPIIFTNLPEGTAVKLQKSGSRNKIHQISSSWKNYKYVKGCRLVDIPLDCRQTQRKVSLPAVFMSCTIWMLISKSRHWLSAGGRGASLA
ncbi:hypothetical protein KEH51_21030 [[Brevibacterium] frigoritolerans]|uniref:Uncharacterized protein n=1 Tax=Peribacillus frigoritolerans TaxID=450367 RepID=A0A941JBC2_9BACI|nr:hypothetical protein [Peribacillus frigoritolerans]